MSEENEVNEGQQEQSSVPSAAEIAAEVAAQMPRPEPEKPRMTDDELREYLQVYEPDGQFAEAFRTALVDEEATADDRAAAFKPLVQGIVNQAVRGAELLIEEKLEDVDKRYGTATQYAQQAQAEAMWNDFTQTYPQLAEHKDLVDMVSTNLLTAGYRPKNKEELYGKVADGAAGMIQKFDQSFKLGQQSQATEMPKMAGQGGTPQGGPAAANMPEEGSVEAIWG